MKVQAILLCGFLVRQASTAGCPFMSGADIITKDLTGLKLKFVGVKPTVTKVSGPPALKILKYSSVPSIETKDGYLVVSAGGTCSADGDLTVSPVTSAPSPPSPPPPVKTTTAATEVSAAQQRNPLVLATSVLLMGLCAAHPRDGIGAVGMAMSLGLAAFTTGVSADAHSCTEEMEIEVSGPGGEEAIGKFYMETTIQAGKYPYESDPASFWFKGTSSWHKDVTASRKFRTLPEGKKAYNYRSKVMMGMAQTNVLNSPPSVTDPYSVSFTLPTVTKPDTEEGIMMLSILEMQALLRAGSLTSKELTDIALKMLKKYDPEYNMLEVELETIAYAQAAKADAEFAKGNYVSFVQGIPFAIKDTFDIKGAATMYGSWEFADNVVQTESPLVTYALAALAVPLFKSTVPQLTWGHANHNGVVYSCLNGGFSSGALDSGGSSIGSGAAVCLGVVPVAICEQTGSSCQAPAVANGISTIIPSHGTFSRTGTGIYSMESDRPGLLCRDIMSCAVMYNYMRGPGGDADPGDPQYVGTPFANPEAEDLSTYTIGFADNSENKAWPHAFDTPLKGKRTNVLDALKATGATVTTKAHPEEFLPPDSQLIKDYKESGIGNEWFGWWDWYWTNVDFFEDLGPAWGYGSGKGKTYGPVWVGQNYNFEQNFHKSHIGTSAYAYLDDLWIHGYVSEMGMFPALAQLPDVVVHFSNSELGATSGMLGTIKRAGINTVHIPEFYWNTTDGAFVDYVKHSDGKELSRPDDYYKETTVSAAMITCESKKYEPVKAFAVCAALQKTLVPGGKLISQYKDKIHAALKDGSHDLHCPFDWSKKMPGYLDKYPASIKAKVEAKMSNIGKMPNCRLAGGAGCDGGTCR